ncbi:MAG TPA: nickel-type superoxide dismutase maturation protease [Candidatus Limnocylindria bacterium]|nr:nickel-type superoxide dismutase maturation protease [Candidatus Limnocylindria bacterium]
MAVLGVLGVLGATLTALAALTARRLDVVAVRGRSMAPTLLPGERLLVERLDRPPRVGEIVVAPDPREPERELVKRVASVEAGGVRLRGDNPAFSTDARVFGLVPSENVGWRVVARLWPPRRFGRPGPAPVAALDFLDEGGEPACAVPESLVAGC